MRNNVLDSHINIPIPFTLNYRVTIPQLQRILEWSTGYASVSNWLQSHVVSYSEAIGKVWVFPFDTKQIPQTPPEEWLPIYLMGSDVQWGDGSTMKTPALKVDVYQGIRYEYEMSRYYHDFRDFEPFSRYDIYLPFCGIFHLPTANLFYPYGDERKITIRVDYAVDMNTGNANAYVYAVKDSGASVLVMEKSCSVSTPIAWNASNISENIGNLATTAVTAGLSIVSGGVGGVAGAAIKSGSDFIKSAASMGQKSSENGNLSGGKELFAGPLFPYIIRTAPRELYDPVTSDYRNIMGRATSEMQTLGDVGVGEYIVVEKVHLENFDGATDSEIKAVEGLLKAGVVM